MTLCSVEITRDIGVTKTRHSCDMSEVATVIRLSQYTRKIQLWFYGPCMMSLRKIVATRYGRWAAINLPDGAGVVSKSADAFANQALVSLLEWPALQAIFLSPLLAAKGAPTHAVRLTRFQRERHAILRPPRHLLIKQQRC